MSRSERNLLFASLAIALLAGAALIIIILRLDANSATDLERWQAATQQPGYRLLDASEDFGYLFCIYDTGDDAIAICTKSASPDAGGVGFLGIRDPDGKDLHDVPRSEGDPDWVRLLHRQERAKFGVWIYHITRGYHGQIQVECRDRVQGYDYRAVYLRTLDLRPDPPIDSAE